MEKIKDIIFQIERTQDVKILYACETGSRAWGFPSPDSDYDVRFIYIHQRDWYLSLNKKRDTIEIMQGDFDITGWDLRKSLLLLKKSNVALIERFQSPIVYHAEKNFQHEFRKLVDAYYSPIAAFYHHYSLAKNVWEDLKNQPEVKLKSFFYLLRSLLSCNWILKDDAVLPMHMDGLMKYVEAKHESRLRELINTKAAVDEKFLYRVDAKYLHFVEDLLSFIEANKDNLHVNNQSLELLNDFFLKMMYGKANS